MLQLIINYKDRDLEFLFKGVRTVKGEGLKNLISKIGMNYTIDRIDINGGSVSYTFSRQVYLFVNLLANLNRCFVCVNGVVQKRDKVLIPSYNQ